MFGWDTSASTLVMDVEGGMHVHGCRGRLGCMGTRNGTAVEKSTRWHRPRRLEGVKLTTLGPSSLGHDSKPDGECLRRRNCTWSRPCAGPIGLCNSNQLKRSTPPREEAVVSLRGHGQNQGDRMRWTCAFPLLRLLTILCFFRKGDMYNTYRESALLPPVLVCVFCPMH
jgi:hypothetical protein